MFNSLLTWTLATLTMEEPSIKIRPLNILSASSVNLHGITNSNVFHNGDFRCGALLFMVIHVIYKYKNK